MTRPNAYTTRAADRICAELASGSSLRKICQAEDMPDRSTVMRWLADERHAKFRDQYARAREAQADALFDEMIDIADTALDRDSAAAAKVRFDARRWVAGKLRPKKYGEKIEVEHGVSDDLAAAIAARRARVAGA